MYIRGLGCIPSPPAPRRRTPGGGRYGQSFGPVRTLLPDPPAGSEPVVTISILLVRGLVEFLEHAEISRQRFLGAAAFDPMRLEDANARIQVDEYDRLVETALDLSGDDALGLHMGEFASTTTYGVAANVVAHASTLRGALSALIRYQCLLNDGAVLRLTESRRQATLALDQAAGSRRCRRFRAELVMTGYHRLVKYFSVHGGPRLVAFEHEAPAHDAEYARIFGGVERFGQPFTGLAVDRGLLDVEQLNHDAEFHAAIEAQARVRVARLQTGTSLAERVQKFIVDGPSGGRHGLTDAARALGTSPRSLRRRLRKEGSSYTDVVESARAMLAKRLLSDEMRSIQDTAYELGFATPSSFHRAFKRWTGATPSEFRLRRAGG